MKILECYIENFGRLHGMKCRLNEGLNSLNADNGWGKSTFASFISAMFYGLEEKRISGQYDPKDHRRNYSPWQGGNFGGYLIFEAGGKNFRVSRFFGERQEDDLFELIDLSTGLPAREFSPALGQELFGIDADGFERSAYIPQNSPETGGNESIHARLLGMLSNDADLLHYDQAIELLSREKETLNASLNNGRKEKLDQKLRELKASLSKAKEAEQKRSELKESLKAIVEEKNKCRIAKETAEHDLSSFMENNNKGKKAGAASVPAIILIIIGILSGAMGAVTLIMLSGFILQGILFIAGALLSIGLGISFILSRQKANRKLSEEGDALQNNVKVKRESYEAALANETKTNQEINDLSEDADKVESLENRIKQTVAEIEDPSEDQSEMLSILDITAKMLGQARNSLSGRYMEKLQSQLALYLKQVGLSEHAVGLDMDFRPSVEEMGSFRPIQALSYGTRDLTYLCARFALVDALYDADRPCIILDDVMNNLDDKHFSKAMAMVESMAENYQIIYLTCNTNRMPETADKSGSAE